jgi:hypothetical protein
MEGSSPMKRYWKSWKWFWVMEMIWSNSLFRIHLMLNKEDSYMNKLRSLSCSIEPSVRGIIARWLSQRIDLIIINLNKTKTWKTRAMMTKESQMTCFYIKFVVLLETNIKIKRQSKKCWLYSSLLYFIRCQMN